MSITNDGEEPSASPARTITVFQAGQQNATIAGTASSTPAITGLRTDGQPWSPTVVKWRVEDLGKGKMLFNSELIAPGDAPIAASVTDLESKVDFTQTIPASQTVRLFGTRYLLP